MLASRLVGCFVATSLAMVLLTASAKATTGSRIVSGYSESLVVATAQAGGMPSVIRGSLGGQSGGVLTDRVRAMLALPAYFPRAGFVAAPAAVEDGKGIRFVVLINPDNVIQAGQRLCGDLRGLSFGANADRFVMLAALCRDTSTLTEVDVREAAVAGPDDARFRRLLNEMMALAFPSAMRERPTSGM